MALTAGCRGREFASPNLPGELDGNGDPEERGEGDVAAGDRGDEEVGASVLWTGVLREDKDDRLYCCRVRQCESLVDSAR